MNAMVTSCITELEIVQELYATRDPQNRLTEDLELLLHCRAELVELLEGLGVIGTFKYNRLTTMTKGDWIPSPRGLCMN